MADLIDELDGEHGARHTQRLRTSALVSDNAVDVFTDATRRKQVQEQNGGVLGKSKFAHPDDFRMK